MKTFSALQKTALSALLILATCLSVQAQSKGSGNLVKQDRTVSAFTEIEAGSAFSLLLTQGEPTQVTVETDDNFLDKIETSVDNNRLTISTEGVKNPTAMRIYITTPNITLIELDGAARLDSKGEIQCTTLKIEASGAAKINMDLNTEILVSDVSGAAKILLKGKSVSHQIDASGAASVDAMQMTSQTIKADISGAAKARVYAISRLEADISGAGAIAYYDNDETKKLTDQGTYSINFDNSEIPDAEELEEIVTATEEGDSTLINIGDIQVQVVEGNPTKVKIGNNELEVDDDGNVDFKRNRKNRFDGHWGGFDIGINGYLNSDMGFGMPEGYDFLDLRYEKSTNVAINLIEQNFNLIRNHFGLTTGLGIEWQNYRFDNNAYLSVDNEGIFGGYYEGDKNYTKSKLVVTYLNLPLLFEYQTNRFSKKNSFHIGAGLLTGLRIGAHTKMNYVDGKKQKEKYKDDDGFDINPFKFALMTRIGWGIVNLYGNYNLNTLFEDNRGPELYPFAVGITLVGW